MRINDILGESVSGTAIARVHNRFEELGLGRDVAELFIDWIYHGQFNLSIPELDKYEAAFRLINSVLPREIIRSYSRLPVMYRGMVFPPDKIKKIYAGGLPIQSRVMAWTPHKQDATELYASNPGKTGVILKYKPKGGDVILSLTRDTCQFLGVGGILVANPDETILSLPLLKITPEIVDTVIK